QRIRDRLRGGAVMLADPGFVIAQRLRQQDRLAILRQDLGEVPPRIVQGHHEQAELHGHPPWVLRFTKAAAGAWGRGVDGAPQRCRRGARAKPYESPTFKPKIRWVRGREMFGGSRWRPEGRPGLERVKGIEPSS